MANVRQQGGAQDANGNFRRLNAEQQQKYIHREIARYLVQNGLAGAQNAQIAAGPLTAKAFGMDEDAQLGQRAPQPRQKGRPHPRGPAGGGGFQSVPASDPAAGLGAIGGALQQGASLQAQGNGLINGLLGIAQMQNQKFAVIGTQMGQLRQAMERVYRDTQVNTPSMQKYGR